MASLQLLINAAIALLALGAIAILALRISATKFSRPASHLIDAIDALLPQTQCGQCGHPGCRPYAEAIAQGEAINRCPPGRDNTIRAIADLLHKPVLPLDGELKPKAVAFIREAECIGCTKCIQACPVDAILGASKLMHTVIVDECTGCDLCVDPCPVDCIEMRDLPSEQYIITAPQSLHYKSRFVAHGIRLQHEQAEHEARRLARKNAAEANKAEPVIVTTVVTAAEVKTESAAATDAVDAAANKQEQIQAAIARAKAKKAASKNPGAQS
jgi:electron transport complex protein RnfB